MARTLLIELRRSTFAAVALVLAVAQVALMLNNVGSWRGVWPMASAQIGAHWLFLAPVAAGFSALQRLRRIRRPGGSTGDPSKLLRSQSSIMLSAHASLACLIVLTGCICAVVVNSQAGAPTGFLWPSYLLIALAFAVESVAVGHLLGSLGGPLWFAPIVAVMFTFLRGAWWQGTGVGTSDASFTRVFLEGHPYVTLDPAGVTSALLEAALVVLLALLTPGLLWWFQARQAGRTLPLGAGASMRMLGIGLVMILGVVAVMSGPPLTRYRQPPANALCTATATQLCMWPEDAVYLPALTRIAERGHAVAEQMNTRLPARIGQLGLAADQQSNFDFLGGSTWSVTTSMADQIAGSLVPLTCAPPANMQTPLDVYYKALWEVSALVQLKIAGDARPAGFSDSTGVDWERVVTVWRAGPKQEKAWIDNRVNIMNSAAQTLCR